MPFTALVSAPDWHPATVAALAGLAVVVANLAVRIAALGIIPANRKPSTGMAWLLAILLNPLLGLIGFGLFGRTRLEPQRFTRQRRAHDRIMAATDEVPVVPDAEHHPAYVASVSHLNRELGALPLLGGNDVELLEDYEGSINAMATAVDAAVEHVHVEFYIAAWDEVTEPLFAAMVAATERGVTVRLLFDHLGSRSIPGHRDFLARLAQTRILWHRMLPVQPLKRKFRRPTCATTASSSSWTAAWASPAPRT